MPAQQRARCHQQALVATSAAAAPRRRTPPGRPSPASASGSAAEHRDLLAQHQQASFAADKHASSASHPASRMNMRYSSRTITRPGSCHHSGHNRRRTRRPAIYAPFWNPTRSLQSTQTARAGCSSSVDLEQRPSRQPSAPAGRRGDLQDRHRDQDSSAARPSGRVSGRSGPSTPTKLANWSGFTDRCHTSSHLQQCIRQLDFAAYSPERSKTASQRPGGRKASPCRPGHAGGRELTYVARARVAISSAPTPRVP